MSEKDLEKKLSDEAESSEVKTEQDSEKTSQADSNAISKESAENLQENKYEDNDNWEFEASAPSVENDVLSSDSGVEFEFSNESVQPTAEVQQPEIQVKSKDIVIKKEKINLILSIIIGVLVIAILVVLGVRYYTMPNSDEKMNPGNIALTVGDTDISVGMYNYYYENVVYEYTYYANYGYYDLDTSADYATQYTTDSDGNKVSWLDLFEKQTVDRIKSNILYYELGVENGIELTDTQKENIESQLDSVKEAASSASMSVNEYVAETYGDYCGLETLRTFLEQYYIAQSYYFQSQITDRPTDEEVETYFNENQAEYKSCSFALLEMNYDTTDDSTKEASVNRAKEYMAKITDVESMKALIPEACDTLIDRFITAGYFETKEEAIEGLSSSLEMTQSRSDVETSFGEDIADWIYSEDTPVGSTNYYVNENSEVVYILLKTQQPFLENTEVYSVRHILVIPKSTANTEESTDTTTSSTQEEYSEEEWAAALEEAEKIVEEYNQTDKTELSFAKLAEKYSDDTESTSSGSSGLYGGGYMGVQLGQMVSEFESWATDDSRKYGDVEIVKSEYGYHIMYFVFDGPEYMYNAQTNLTTEKSLDLLDKLEVKERAGFSEVTVAEPESN